MARLSAGVGLIALVRFSKKLTLNLSNWISMHTRSLIAKVPNPWNANKDLHLYALRTCCHLCLKLRIFGVFLHMWIFLLAYSLKTPKAYWTSIASILLEKQCISSIRPYLKFGKKKSETAVLEAKPFVKIFCYKKKLHNKCKKIHSFRVHLLC